MPDDAPSKKKKKPSTARTESKFCEICNFGPGHREMQMIQCRECKLFVHSECYFADIFFDDAEYVDNTKKFLCIACQSIGRKVQAVETHRSTNYHMIKQRERPLVCELCSVSDKVTAMHPLYDYHGLSGRQLCVKTNDDGNYRLAWGHTLCCLYLSTLGSLYGVKANGRYQNNDEGDDDEDDEGEGPDPREPNPTSVLTPTFRAAVLRTEAITHYRYYAPFDFEKKAKDLDVYREAVYKFKEYVDCVICNKSDKDRNVLRIPQECVAGCKNEFDWINSGRIQKKGNLHPGLKVKSCPMGLHVGCARFGLPNPGNVQRVHWWHGNPEEEACLYCTKHAMDVGIKLPEQHEKHILEIPKLPTREKKIQQEKQVLEVPKVPTKAKETQKKPVAAAKAVSAHGKNQSNEGSTNKTIDVPRKSFTFNPPQAAAQTLKRKSLSQTVDLGTVLPSASIPRKKKQKPDTSHSTKSVEASGRTSPTPTGARRGNQWIRFLKPKDRYAELDSSLAVAVNAGDRPTLKNKRRELADQKSKVSEEKVQLVVKDLLKKVPKLSAMEGFSAAVKGRKLFWKREFSELTKEDFKIIWEEAKRTYSAIRNSKRASGEIAAPAQANAVTKNVIPAKNVVDLVGDEDVSIPASGDAKKDSKPHNRSEETTIVEAPKDSVNETTAQELRKPYRDRWSHLFVGPLFRMGNEFTLDDFEEYV